MSDIEILNVGENNRRVEMRVGHVNFEFFKFHGEIFHQTINYDGGSCQVEKSLYMKALRQAAAILNKK
jgi:hypothetical protein